MCRTLQIVLICLSAVFSSCVNVRPVYFEDDKKTVEAAVRLFTERFNNEDYGAIYDDTGDVFKSTGSKEQIVSLMKTTREQNGKTLEVADSFLKVVPGAQIQVRSVYNFKCEKGERSFWFTYLIDADGKAVLAQIQAYGAYTDLSKYKKEEIK